MSRTDQMLVEWKNDSLEKSKNHSSSANKMTGWFYGLSVPAILSSLAIGSLLAYNDNANVQVALSVISFLTAALNGVITVLRPNENAKKHKDASAEYAIVARTIDTIRRLEESKEKEEAIGNIQELLASLQKEYPDSSCLPSSSDPSVIPPPISIEISKEEDAKLPLSNSTKILSRALKEQLRRLEQDV